MTNTKTLLKALMGATALTVFATGTAQAQNNFTPAETTVSNTFTLDYKVGGVDQTQIDSTGNETEFTVDRLVDLVVTSNGDKIVVPGALDQTLVFSVTNDGNDIQAYELTFIEEATGTGDDTINTDDSAASTARIVYFIDDGDGVFEETGADGTATTYTVGGPLPELAPDQLLWVQVTQDIPITANDEDQADVSLLANAFQSAAAGGAELLADTGGNTLTGLAENVLADGTGSSNDEDNNGAHSATGAYILVSAEIEGDKVVTIFSEDGSGCTTIDGTAGTGGYGIPGACVEYVISVENTGSAEATAVSVIDELPGELKFATATFGGDFTGGAFDNLPSLNDDCGLPAGCTIDFIGSSLPAPVDPATVTTGTVTIRAFVK